MRRPTNRRASEGFEGNAAGPITSYKVCSLFHTVHSRSSSRDLQEGRSQVRVPLGVGWGGGVRAAAAVLLSTAWQLTRAPHATYIYMHEYRRVQTRERDVSDTSPKSTPPPHPPALPIPPLRPPPPSQSCPILTQISFSEKFK